METKMKMKNKLLTVVTILIITTALIGCKDFLGETAESKIDYHGTTILHGTISNYKEVIIDGKNNNEPSKINANARTITPNIDSGNYDFYLYGEMGSNHWGPNKISDDNQIGLNGKFEAELEYGQWNLTLIVVKKGVTPPDRGNIAQEALLIAKDYADLTKKEECTATFSLTPEGLSRKGNIDFTIVLDGWELPTLDHLNIEACLTDYKTGDIIEGTKQNYSATTAGTTAKDGTVITGKPTFTYTHANAADTTEKIDPGIYNFRLTFYEDVNNDNVIDETEKSFFVYNEDLMVFPGDVTNETLWLPELFGAKPNSPEFFFASVETNTTDPYVPKTKQNEFDTGSEKYEVYFEWAKWDKDGIAIRNATHYELQIAKISGIAGKDITTFNLGKEDNTPNGTNPLVWTNAGNVKYIFLSDNDTEDSSDDNTKSVINDANKLSPSDPETYDRSVVGKGEYVSGHLLNTSDHLSLFLPLGEEYTARIRAVGPTGESEWTYVSLTPKTSSVHLSASESKTTGTDTKNPSKTPFKGKTINNYAIRYYLNGGVTTDKSGEYFEQFGPVSSSGVQYWDAYSEDLKKNGVIISAWKELNKEEKFRVCNPSDETTPEYSEASSAAKTYNPWSPALGDKGYVSTKIMTAKSERVTELGVKYQTEKFYYTKDASDSYEAPSNSNKWEYLGRIKDIYTVTSAVALNYYEGYENLELFAQYKSKVMWNIVTDTKLSPDGIKYAHGIKGNDGTITYETATDLKPEDSTKNALEVVYDPTKGSYIKWILPRCEEDKEYDYLKATIKTTDGTNLILESTKLKNPSSQNLNELVTYVGNCTIGKYLVTIEAGLPNTALTDTLAIILTVN